MAILIKGILLQAEGTEASSLGTAADNRAVASPAVVNRARGIPAVRLPVVSLERLGVRVAGVLGAGVTQAPFEVDLEGSLLAGK